MAISTEPGLDLPGIIDESLNRVIRIKGGTPLRGAVTIGGAKNAALPALAATLLTGDECVLNNVPNLADITNMAELLRDLGAEVDVEPNRHRIRVRAKQITNFRARPDLVTKMRASFLVAGPLLARYGEVISPLPGGCQLGSRPVDVDIRGFRKMMASVEVNDQEIAAKSTGLRGTQIYMDYPSHTGTENLLMAATLATGRTTIVHGACEPEIVSLGEMLNRMGAQIKGLGSPTIVVEGVDRLHGVSVSILPDRLEAGTFAIGAVLTKGEVRINNVREWDMLPLTAKLRDAGAEVWSDDDSMLIRPGDELRSVEIQTMAFPGFPTDLQAAFATLMTQANGLSRIHERVFEDRLRYTDQLNEMGANIWVDKFAENRYGTRAEIHGPTPLHGASLRALDIRAGAGLVLAGLIASGETVISDVYHLDRGYEQLVPKFQQLEAQIIEENVPLLTSIASDGTVA